MHGCRVVALPASCIKADGRFCARERLAQHPTQRITQRRVVTAIEKSVARPYHIAVVAVQAFVRADEIDVSAFCYVIAVPLVAAIAAAVRCQNAAADGA